MKVQKYVKSGLAVVIFVIAAFVVYSFVPRVGQKQSSYGTLLEDSASLPDEFQKNIELFFSDTALNSQVAIGMKNEKILFQYGETERLINCHSIRKSIVGLLFGIARDHGIVDLDETLGELGIDETATPLTEQEKKATIKNLLMARSGVYLAAEAEVDYAKNNRPARGQHEPGEYFFYNNFDFNVLGYILEQKSGLSLGEFMEKYLAEPLGMQDFSSKNVVYGSPWPISGDTNSDYEAYWIFLSARDLARIGTMVAQDGKWDNRQVVSREWILESTRPYTDLADYDLVKEPVDAFGYLWWIDTDANIIWADGYGGQYMLVDPETDLVLVQRNFTGNSLLTSGLFLMDENRDVSNKNDLYKIYKDVKNELQREQNLVSEK